MSSSCRHMTWWATWPTPPASSTPRPPSTASRAATPCGPHRCTVARAASGRLLIATATPWPSDAHRPRRQQARLATDEEDSACLRCCSPSREAELTKQLSSATAGRPKRLPPRSTLVALYGSYLATKKRQVARSRKPPLSMQSSARNTGGIRRGDDRDARDESAE